MSMCTCAICEDIYDTDNQFEINELGDCICDNCADNHSSVCDCCGEDRVCKQITVSGVETNVCYECSKKKLEP